MNNLPAVDDVLRDGIRAVDAGDRATARTLFEQVVARDQRHEKGWFWLASVVDTEEEQRVCLGNVIVINPQNSEARQLLDRLAPTPVPASGLGSLALAAAGLAVIAVLAAVLVLTLPGPKPAKSKVTRYAVTGGNPLAALSLNPTSTPPPQATARLTATNRPRPTSAGTAQPTWTPLPSTPIVVVTPTLRIVPAPPDNLRGRVIMVSGHSPDWRNQSIVIMAANGSQRYELTTTERGHTPILYQDRYAFIHYATGTQEMILEHARMDGTGQIWFWTGTPLLDDQDTPDWSPDGAWIAFTAEGYGMQVPDLYLVTIGTQAGDDVTLERLTDDNTAESWPSFSPDSRFIVYAASPASGSGQELRIYNLETEISSDLTSNGSALIETAPDWSPDARNVVFEARAEGESQSDIYMIDASGLTEPRRIIESEGNDIQPRFSPDGRYIVFSSNRTGYWDVYIYELASKTLYQLTADPRIDIANDWEN
jgi:hypothetical protein